MTKTMFHPPSLFSRAVTDVDSTPTVLPAIVLGTVGTLSLFVQSGLVQSFVSKLGLAGAAASDLAISEMVGVAFASTLTALSVRHLAFSSDARVTPSASAAQLSLLEFNDSDASISRGLDIFVADLDRAKKALRL